MSAVLLIVLIVLEVVNLVTSWRLRHYTQRLQDIKAAKVNLGGPSDWNTNLSRDSVRWANAHQPLDRKDQR